LEYKLAKQLKDKGYPQNPQCGHCSSDCGGTVDNVDGSVYIPTLEELIEACVSLNKKQKKYWSISFGFPTTDEDSAMEKKDYVIHFQWVRGEGRVGSDSIRSSIPTEAVAKLWIKLNE